MGILFEIKKPSDAKLGFFQLFFTLFFIGILAIIEIIPTWILYSWTLGVYLSYHVSKLSITLKA